MYNTAVKGAGSVAEKFVPFEGIWGNERITVFHYNACDGWNEIFDKADAIHSGIAWKNGYQKFTEGTDAEGSEFMQYVKTIADFCKNHGKAGFIICGRQMLSWLKPDKVVPIKFKFHHNYPAYYAVWNCDIPFSPENEDEGRKWVADHYETILDPSCGYGDALLKVAKKAILSDINNGCLKYIIDKYALKQVSDGKDRKTTGRN